MFSLLVKGCIRYKRNILSLIQGDNTFQNYKEIYMLVFLYKPNNYAKFQDSVILR